MVEHCVAHVLATCRFHACTIEMTMEISKLVISIEFSQMELEVVIYVTSPPGAENGNGKTSSSSSSSPWCTEGVFEDTVEGCPEASGWNDGVREGPWLLNGSSPKR